MNRIKVVLLLAGFLVLTLGAPSSVRALPLNYQVMATAADYCGAGGIRFFTYSYGYQSPMGWSVYGQLPSISAPGDYVAFSWSLADEAGGLASGSWDSRTGASTGGTYGTSWSFNTSRFPVGDVAFQASGSVRGRGGSGTSCEQSFYATSYASMGGGGYSYLKASTSPSYVFQNAQSGLALQIAGSSTADYEPATQDAYTGALNQQWTLSEISAGGRYDFVNRATGKPLYSDFQSGSPSVYQLAGASRAWRFVSAGDGSVYLVYEYVFYTAGVPQYAMEPAGGSSGPVTIESLQRENRLSQRWLITTQ